MSSSDKNNIDIKKLITITEEMSPSINQFEEKYGRGLVLASLAYRIGIAASLKFPNNSKLVGEELGALFNIAMGAVKITRHVTRKEESSNV